MWEINKGNVGPDYTRILDELVKKLDEAEMYRDVPEWLAWKGLLDAYKMDRMLLSKQIEKIKKELSDT